VANAVQSVRISNRGIRMHGASISQTDDYGRYMGIGPREGFLAKDAAGTTIHQIPTAPILVGAYPMDHFFQLKYDNAAYTLLDSAAFAVLTWYAQQALDLNNEEVFGIRLKSWIHGQGPASSLPRMSIALRPYGSGWSAGTTDMSIQDVTSWDLSSSAVTAVDRVCVLDVPVSSDLRFEWYVNVVPRNTAYRLILQQIGVWI
jgi:hypothetical protein